MLYEIYNHLVDTDFTSQLTLRQSSIPEVMHLVSYNHSAAVLLTPNSFLPRTARDWNALAMDLLLFQTVDAFTSSLICHVNTSVFNLTTFLSTGNVANYPAAVRLSTPKKSHCQRKMKTKMSSLWDDKNTSSFYIVRRCTTLVTGQLADTPTR